MAIRVQISLSDFKEYYDSDPGIVRAAVEPALAGFRVRGTSPPHSTESLRPSDGGMRLWGAESAGLGVVHSAVVGAGLAWAMDGEEVGNAGDLTEPGLHRIAL